MATKVESTVIINRPPEIVFDVLTDVGHHTAWATGPDSIRNLSENPARLGTTWTQGSKFLGREIESEMTVHVYEPVRRFGFQTTKPVPSALLFTLEPLDGGTKVIFSAELEPGGVISLATPLLQSKAQDQMDRDLTSLKERLEADVPAPEQVNPSSEA